MVKKRIAVLNKRLEKYFAMKKELDECDAVLKSLGVFEKPSETMPTKPADLPADPADLCYDATNMKPMSTIGLQLFASMPIEFTALDLSARMNNNKAEAYQFVASWKQAGKLMSVQRGLYRKTGK